VYLASWLKSIRNRVSRTQRRPLRSSRRLRTEHLEKRTLLTVTGVAVGTELTVFVDSINAITVQRNSATDNIEILENGTPSPSVPLLNAETLTGLHFLGGDQDNSINLTGLTTTAFPMLTTITVDAGDGEDLITGSDAFAESLAGGDGHDTIIGNSGNDTLDGGDGDDSLLGLAGDDSLVGGNGADTLEGEAGDDTLSGGDGNDSILAAAGDDSVNGGQGADVIDGSTGDDSISGGEGNDTISGDVGNDTIFGGADNDSILAGDGDDSVNGDGGHDEIFGEAGLDDLSGDDGNDTISGGDDEDRIIGNDGDDSLLGDDASDTIIGGGGNDFANGGFGDDIIRGNSGNDTLCGGFDSDFIEGDAGDDLIQSVCEPVTPVGISLGDVNIPEGGVADVVIVIDISGSTFSSFVGTPVGDQNGDGFSDTILDVEIASVLAFQQDLIARGVTANLSVIAFESTSQILDMDPSTPGLDLATSPTADNDGNGVTDFEQIVRSLMTTGGTAFEPPLQDVITVFTGLGTGAGDGTLVFLSDGIPFDGLPMPAYADEVATINGLGVTSRAFLIDSGFLGTTGLMNLQVIDPGAVVVTSSDALVMELSNLGVSSGQSFVDIVLSQPAPAPFTVSFATSAGTATPGVDYTATSGTISFAAGQSAATIPIEILNDTLIEDPPETFFITLSNAVTAGGSSITPIVLLDPTAQITIYDRGSIIPANPPLPVADPLPPVSRGIDPNPDTMLGGTGNDTIIGDLADDILEGNEGNDSLDGGQGGDDLDGGTGKDTIRGSEGDDTLAGGGADDVLDGGDGINDLIWTGVGDGNDVILESAGIQRLSVLGTDADESYVVDEINNVVRVSSLNASITVSDSTTEINLLAGGGNDTVTVNSLRNANPLVLRINGEAGDDVLSAAGADTGRVRILISGGDGNDAITGGLLRDILTGDAGEDTIRGGSGDDDIQGGDGNDEIYGENGNDIVDGGIGNDSISGGKGHDSLNGGFDADYITGDSGNDTVNGGFGNDIVVGNSGADLIKGNQGDDSVYGGAGDDRLDGGAGHDYMRGHSGNDVMKGGDGDDSMFGDGGDDTMSGGDGDDVIEGRDGFSVIDGGDGNDKIVGGAFNDTLIGGDGNDTIFGGAGNDRIYGGDGDDILKGHGSTDLYNSGEGDDTLIGLTGNEFDNLELQMGAAIQAALAALDTF
jgi:Ca2+-binding RTX toxin-like protein